MMTIRPYAAAAALFFLWQTSACATAPPVSLETYMKMTDDAYVSPSPDGTRIAYTSQETGTWQLWITTSDGSRRTQVTHGSDGADLVAWVPGSANTILYSQSRGGSGVDQLYFTRADGSGTTPLFPNEANVTHTFGAFSPDGSKLAYSSNSRKQSAFDVWVYDRAARSSKRVFTVDGNAYATAWSPDGRRLLVQRVLTPYDHDLYVVDVAHASSRLITRHSGEATFDSAQFTADGRGVVCITDLNREFHNVVRIDPATSAVRTLVDVPNDVDDVRLSPDGHRMAYIVNRDGFGDVVIADAQNGQTIETPAMPPSIAEAPVFTRNGSVLLFAASGPTFPKVLWSYDLRSHASRRILRPNFHGVAASSLVEPQVVHVRSFDGTMIPAWYFLPKHHRGNFPVLLDIHGGPEEQDRAWFYPFAQYLAARGFALLDPNIRGSTGYGRAYLHAADGRKRENAIRDIGALRQWLVTAGGADPRSVFIDGASYGGYVVLSSLYHYPHAFAGGADIYGVADWVDFLQKTAPARRANREGVYGSLSRDRAFLKSISPIEHVSQIHTPTLIVAGANDTIVPVSQSRRIAAALRRTGTPVQLHVFPNEGHGISHVSNLVALYRWMIAFMQHYAGQAA